MDPTSREPSKSTVEENGSKPKPEHTAPSPVNRPVASQRDDTAHLTHDASPRAGGVVSSGEGGHAGSLQ